MEYLAVCTFEIKGGLAADYESSYDQLKTLGFHRDHLVGGPDSDLPSDAIAGTFKSNDVGFLRNCLSYKLQETFTRLGFDAEFLVVISQGDLAWVRGGYAVGDFAERHGRGSLAVSA